MHSFTLRLLPAATLWAFAASPLAAQGLPFLFTTSQTEQTMSGSGGTVLQTLRPNEVARVEFTPCPVVSAEKWGPRTCYQTMAGDEDWSNVYFNPTLFARIDALVDIISPVGLPNQRTVYWSPSAPMGNAVSALPFRPGDTARVIRNGTFDGQVEYFLRAEHVQQALGLPISPIVVDVDAIAADPGYGVFLSLDGTHVCNLACGPQIVQDGDVLVIPASAITPSWDFRVLGVTPNSASVLYTEAQIDAMVLNAQVTDRNGVCVNTILDLEALDIDYSGPVVTAVPCAGNIITAPTLIFSGETLTGCSLLSTDLGGSILNRGCGQIGRSCGGGPTFGFEMGLQPPSTTQGVASHVNALTTTWSHLFVIEPKQHVIPAFTPVVIDVNSPSPFTWVVVSFAPWFPGSVAPSTSFPNQYFPDLYITPPVLWSTNTGAGFTTITSPAIPWSCRLVWQAVSLGSGIDLSTPATVDVQ
ncbi:MAG: hypothetical protein IPK26_02500 [Planctomycetes bacterium]|nr:hypothetical protein [Planctomycetota bacterium]